MADVEARVETLETKFITLEQQISNVTTKLDMFIDESRAERKRQDADMREMREDMRNLRTDLNNLGNYFRTTNLTVIIGIAAMVVAVLLK